MHPFTIIFGIAVAIYAVWITVTTVPFLRSSKRALDELERLIEVPSEATRARES